MLLFDYEQEPLYLPEQKPWLPGVKPVQQEVEIDWDNPLTNGLIVYADYGVRRDPVAATDTSGIGSTGRFLVNKIGAAFYGSIAGSGAAIASDDKGLHLNTGGSGGLGVYLPSGWDNSWLTEQEVTWLCRIKRSSAQNNFLSDFDATQTSHYPFSGVAYCGIFRTSRITLTGVYDSSLDDTWHNVCVTNSNSANEWKFYTKGIPRWETTTGWGAPSTAADAFLFGASSSTGTLTKKVQYFALWDRALSKQEIASLERDPYQLLKPKAQKIQVPYTPDPALSLPNPRWERPEMLLPARKPTGAVTLDQTNAIVRSVGLSKRDIVHITDDYHLLNGKRLPLRSGTASVLGPTINGYGLTSNADADDGLTFGKSDTTDYSFHGASEATMLFVMRIPGSAPSTESGIFNERQVSTGANITVLASGNLRAILDTTGTNTWSAAYDESISAFYGKLCVIGLTYDGVNRHMYCGEVGTQITLLDSDACTGTIRISDTNLAEPIIGGSLRTDTYGWGTIYGGILSKKCLRHSDVVAYCLNPYQFLIPA